VKYLKEALELSKSQQYFQLRQLRHLELSLVRVVEEKKLVHRHR
jgi:hypothetical protein